MKIKRKVATVVVYIIILFVWWDVTFRAQASQTEILDIGPYQTEFTATMDTINGIGPCNESTEEQKYYEKGHYELVLEIIDQDGEKIAQLKSIDTKIHLNGYTSQESSNFAGLPVRLKEGETYYINYVCIGYDGTSLDHLSFRLYGRTKSADFITGIPFIIAGLAVVICLCFIKRDDITRLGIVVLSILYVLQLGLMPTIESKEESIAFANTYYLSSQIMGVKNLTDENGMVYIQEDGIRNSRYTNYLNSIIIYWTSLGKNSNTITIDGTSSFYKTSHFKGCVYQLPAALALTGARILGAPYQVMRIAGWLANAIVMIIIGYKMLLKLQERPMMQIYYLCLIILPSVIIAGMSYTSQGIFIALLMWLIASLVVHNEKKWTSLEKWTIAIVALLEAIYMFQKFVDLVLLASGNLNWKEGLKTSIFNCNEIIEEMITYDGGATAREFLAVYALLTVIIIVKWKADFANRNCTYAKEINVISSVVTIWSLLLLLIRGAFSNEIMVGVSTDLINGFIMFPLFLMPWYKYLRRNATIKDQTTYTEVKTTWWLCATVILNCFAFLWRWSSL